MPTWEYKALDGSPAGNVEAVDLATATDLAHAAAGPAGCEYIRVIPDNET